MEPTVTPILVQDKKYVHTYIKICIGLLGVGLLFLWISYPPVRSIESSSNIVRVERGETLTSVAQKLYEGKYIRSKAVFETMVMLVPGKSHVVYGDYYFDKRVPVWVIASRMSNGVYNISQIRMTVWEGMSVNEISLLVETLVPSIDAQDFKLKARDFEGYLFPDTYFISPFSTSDDIIKKMQENFDLKIRSIESEITSSGRSVEDIIIMASIIEKESKGNGDQNTISGILWNRINEGYPLQVDASFLYLLGKESADLTLLDLKTDSPYNTYLYKGLPPGPIGNPGMQSIMAALYPEKTEYMFYLHSPNGTLHPAKTFAEHVQNKQKYLK